MKVSIVMPTLNEEKLLDGALKSIKKQKTDHEVELIIVDSYSKDKTLDIARKYADEILFTPPGIIAAAREHGSRKSSGDIIVSAGADNVYHRKWLDELTSPIASGKAVGTAGRLVPRDGNAIESLFSNVFLSPFSGLSMSLGIPLIAGESMAFSRKAYLEIGGFRTDLVTGEDIDLIKKLMKIGKVAYCEKSIAYVSTRRVREWGYARYLWFHGTNFVRMNITGRTHGSYDPVR
jgi:glycosyltransferase involved in cell wall biosynthesis